MKNIRSGELKYLLEAMEHLDATATATPNLLLDIIDASLLIFGEIVEQNDYSEKEFDNIMNYCILKMLQAKKMIENEDVEVGLPFAKSVLTYFLKGVKLGRPFQNGW